VAISSGATGTLTNQAKVSSTTPDPNLANNDAVDGPAAVTTSADLSISKTHTGTFVAGTNATYSIVVTNNGPSASADATVTDVLPAGLMFVSTSSTGWTCTGTFTVTCTHGLIGNGATTTVDLVVAVAANLTGSVSNEATVTSSTGDPTPTNNKATDGPTTIATSADLAVTKSHVGPVVAGTNATYSIAVTNNGPSDAATASVVDTLPTGFSFVSSPSTGWSCSGTTSVTCAHGSIANGATSTVDLVVVVASNVTGSVTNGVVVSSTTPDPNAGNNSASDGPTTIVTNADLSATKIHGGSLIAGTNATFTVLVKNNGPSDTVDAKVVDALPPGVTFVSTSSAGWTCTGATTVTCTQGPIVTGATATVDLLVAIASDATGTLSNSATVSSATPDLTPANNTATDGPTPLLTSADLLVTKVHAGTLVAGTTTTYTIAVSNFGPSAAADAKVVDVLPAGVMFVSTASAGWSCTGAFTVTCTHGSIAAGATASVDLLVAIAANVTGTVSNTATVSSTTGDPTLTNNSATDGPTPVATSADVSVTKSHVGPIVAGSNVTYSLTATNAGPSNAADITVTDTLPPNMTFVSTSSAGWTCSGTTTVTCTHGPLIFSASSTVDVLVAVTANAAPVGSTNAASVSSTTADPLLTNNSTTDAGPVTRSADLTITKTQVSGPVVAGKPVGWTITVRNNGPSDAPAVVVNDTAPLGLTGVTATPSQGTCTAALVCAIGTMANGATVTVDVTGTVLPNYVSPTLANTAGVSSDAPDPTPANNNSTVSSPATTIADLVISKSATPTKAVPGSPITWTVTVQNIGPSDAQAVTVNDVLPSQIGGVTVASSQGLCTGTSCALGTLPVGGTATVTVNATVDPTLQIAISNSAAVTSSTPDPVSTNNSVTLVTKPDVKADLTVTKTGPTESVVPGTSATWTITVRNSGPSASYNTHLVDPIVEGTLINVVGNPSAGSCAIASSVLDCDLGVVGVNATVTITVSAIVAPAFNGANLVNTATVTTDATDLNPADNTATTTNVNAPLTNVSVTLRSDMPAVISGQDVQFTAVVTTSGPSDAYNVIVTFPVPDGLENITIGGVSCSIANGTATCALGHTVVGSVTLIMRARVSPSFLGSIVPLTVRVVTDTTETTSTDNSAASSVATTQYADLKVTKKASTDNANYGDSVTYTLHVTNNGPSNALHAKVVDDMPKGLAVQTATSDAFTCSWSTQQLVCTASSLPVGAFDIEVVTRVIATGRIDNSVTVTADVAGATTERVHAIVEVPPSAKLTVTKEPDKKVTSASDQVVYTITVHNDGPDSSPNVKVLEPLNYALFLRKAEVSQGEYSKQTGYWSVGDLAPGETATLHITARVNVQGIIKNEIAVADDYMRANKQPPIKVVASVYSKGGTELPITGADIDHTVELGVILLDLGILMVGIAVVRRRRRAIVSARNG
jgi:large repetitive protein